MPKTVEQLKAAAKELLNRSAEDEHLDTGEALELIEALAKVETPEGEEDDDGAWRKEIAMEEGMLHGVDAYNDAMGYSLGNPDDGYDPNRGY